MPNDLASMNRIDSVKDMAEGNSQSMDYFIAECEAATAIEIEDLCRSIRNKLQTLSLTTLRHISQIIKEDTQ